MTGLLLHDTNRPGGTTWSESLIDEGIASGVILSPFCTPRVAVPRIGRTPGREGAAEIIARVQRAGGEVFLDTTTHGVLAPGANLFDNYDTWGLWTGTARGSLSRADLLAHVDTSLAAGSALGARVIAPTLPLGPPVGLWADLAFEMAERAVSAEPDAFVSIVGTPEFWTAGAVLDSYIGELAQLAPLGWSVTVLRPTLAFPPPGLDPNEVAGVCRTVHSLSMRNASVIASHGDFGALPAVAAGADYVGTGFDLRHKVCANDMFRESTGVRRPGKRVTHRGLLAWMKRAEAESLLAADAAASARLIPGTLPIDHNAHWHDHLATVSDRVRRVASAGDRERRVRRLRRMYQVASTDFDATSTLIGKLEVGRSRWIDAYSEGLEIYATGEGW